MIPSTLEAGRLWKAATSPKGRCYVGSLSRYDNQAMRTVPILILVAAFSLASGADNKKTEIKCAVQGIKINIAEAMKDHMYADYKGRRYFFCCSGCPETFKQDPEKYKSAESIPTPKAAKKAKK